MNPQIFLLLANPLPEPMLLVGVDGSILAANHSAVKRLGLSSVTPAGINLPEFTTEPADQVRRFLTTCSRSRSLVTRRFTVRNADGNTSDLTCRGALVAPRIAEQEPLVLLRFESVVAVPPAGSAANEPTPPPKSETVEPSSSKSEPISDSLLEIMKSVRERRAATPDASAQLLAEMGNELLAPLNAIIDGISLEEEALRNLGQKTASKRIRKIAGMLTHVATVLGNVIHFSKIDTARLDIRRDEFEVSELMQELESAFAPYSEKQSNTLEFRALGELGTMWSDRAKVRQVLANLLDNAGKFTDRGKIIVVSHREKVGDRDWLVFKVSDTGSGIPESRQTKLFIRPAADDRPYSYKNAGVRLGLPLAHTFCEELGGTLQVQTEVGSGSTFLVRLPAQAPVEIDKKPAVAERTDESP